MADDRLRELERAAAQGDPEASAAYARERCRSGDHCACRKPIPELVLLVHSIEGRLVTVDRWDEGVPSRRARVPYGPETVSFTVSMRAGDRVKLRAAITEVYERLGVVAP